MVGLHTHSFSAILPLALRAALQGQQPATVLTAPCLLALVRAEAKTPINSRRNIDSKRDVADTMRKAQNACFEQLGQMRVLKTLGF